nr:hypothetical protein [uncultured Draconibacterium sp.]
MNIDQANKNEQERLKYLIENEQDHHNKKCLVDDLAKLENSPKEYWLSFNLQTFQPGNILETQRVNTIAAIQQFYTK